MKSCEHIRYIIGGGSWEINMDFNWKFSISKTNEFISFESEDDVFLKWIHSCA